MEITPFHTEHFEYDGRGPSLHRWLYDKDFVLPGTERGSMAGSIVGAEYHYSESRQWVIFKGRQVIQIVPEEVHSYWFMKNDEEDVKYSGIWSIQDSHWIKSFDPRHLSDQRHFVLVFYDALVEVICRELVFGSKPFNIVDHPELSWFEN